MAIAKGQSFADLVSRVSIGLSDPEGRGYTSDQIMAFFNQALRDLAKEGVFHRRDVQEITAGQCVYSTFCEYVRIDEVRYNRKSLIPIREEEARAVFGEDWRTEGGTPRYFMTIGESAIRLVPNPDASSGAIAVAGSPTLTEAQGAKINGEGFNAVNDSGTIVHFTDGDGVVPTAFSTPGTLEISYAYMPRPSVTTDTVPSRYETILTTFAEWQCVSISDVPEEQAGAATKLQAYEAERRQLIDQSRNGNRILAVMNRPSRF